MNVIIVLGNDSVNTFPPEPTRATIGRLLLQNDSVNTPRQQKRLCFLCAPCQLVIKKCSVAWQYRIVDVIENWVEFWRWQSKVIEEMARKELGRAKKTSCVFWYEIRCQDTTSED
jgi:hypothetical protein